MYVLVVERGCIVMQWLLRSFLGVYGASREASIDRDSEVEYSLLASRLGRDILELFGCDPTPVGAVDARAARARSFGRRKSPSRLGALRTRSENIKHARWRRENSFDGSSFPLGKVRLTSALVGCARTPRGHKRKAEAAAVMVDSREKLVSASENAP